MLDAANGDTERQMDILRHFKQAQVFRLVAQDLAGILPLEKLCDQLCDLADLILGETLRLCWAGLRIRHRDNRASPSSATANWAARNWATPPTSTSSFSTTTMPPEAAGNLRPAGQRINTWLTSLTSAGMLYETDLRLRPNGASGLLVSTRRSLRALPAKPGLDMGASGTDPRPLLRRRRGNRRKLSNASGSEVLAQQRDPRR